jgi:hypothetical protein
MRFAPRISPRLLDEVERLARRSMPVAGIHRSVGALAERLALPRPSYEQVRVLVREARALRRGPTTAALAADALLRTRATRGSSASPSGFSTGRRRACATAVPAEAPKPRRASNRLLQSPRGAKGQERGCARS